MHVDFNRPLVNFMGLPVLDEQNNPLTLRRVACLALTTRSPGDEKATMEDKLDREGLALSIWHGYASELAVEKVALIKARISLVYPSPLMLGAAVRVIEGQPDPMLVEDETSDNVVPLARDGD